MATNVRYDRGRGKRPCKFGGGGGGTKMKRVNCLMVAPICIPVLQRIASWLSDRKSVMMAVSTL